MFDVVTTTENFALQVPPIDLGTLAADFILKLLTEQKLTQVNIKYVMNAGRQLVNNSVNNKLQEDIRLITFKVFLDLWEEPILRGMIEPVNIKLPIQRADFGRHKTGKDQHFKPKTYIYVPILKQLENWRVVLHHQHKHCSKVVWPAKTLPSSTDLHCYFLQITSADHRNL
ncbi:hypothetical protein OUZ56_012322 [Daphnia magna]|uniref:Uncharacterized protein n=1 Tax=Daphnia magna TaxID=35525 RepID=A0ABQ9Z2Y2_9CRUS|nr:hypothetical protein OUZ56_012322 [Daphnia magna]